MRPRRRAAGVLLAAALLAPTALAGTPGTALAGTPGTALAGTPDRIASEPSKIAGTPVSVTLITGDKVIVSGPNSARVEPAPGRRHIKFVASRAGGHLHVRPTDALPLLREGKVDSRLFDVTALIEAGYDDKRADLPLIVTGPVASARSARAGVTGVRALPGGSAVRVAKSGIGAVWQNLSAGVRAEGTARGGQASKIWLDGKRKPLLTESVPQIGAPTAWAAGFDGTGVKVAVVDSGIDADHPDLAGRVVAAENFSEEPDTLDRVFHGTHVAATIASTGAAPGGYKGVAPGASLLSAKVCGVSDCSDSAIIAGMQWAAEQGAKVANVSLGASDLPGEDPVEAAVERITAEFGMLFVVAAGNYGRDATIASPASTDAALTVGAVDKADNLAPFSSRGPRLGDSALKPDITAPGVDITAALSSDVEADLPPGTTHVASSGTSMSAPHVAGAAAILAQRHPDWTPAQLKAGLMASAAVKPEIAVYSQGAGRVDAARAVTQTVTTDPASVSFGLESWPHTDDAPDARTITYRNTGPADVTLALTLAGTLPAGLFTLSASTLTVPAGGTAGVTLTSDTRANVPDGRHGGHVVATAGSTRVVTPFAVDKELESYSVTADRLDRAGQPTESGFVTLVNLDTGESIDLDGPGRIEARVPAGRYTALGVIVAGNAEAPDISVVVDPTVVIDRAVTLTVDARKAKPISIGVPAGDAVPVLADLRFIFRTPAWGQAFIFLGSSYDGMYIGQTDPAERQPILTTVFDQQMVKGPLPDEGPLQPSPYAYYLAQVLEGHAPSGYSVRLAERDLARVEATYHSQGVPTAETGVFALVKDVDTWTVALPVTLPGRRTEFYSVHPSLTWTRELDEGGFDQLLSLQLSEPGAFRAGRTTNERVNAAVFGPSFGGFSFVGRRQNDLYAAPWLFAAAGPWNGTSQTESSRTVLERNGQVIFDQPFTGALIPGLSPEQAAYKLRVEAVRGAPHRLSTRVSAEWTFRSGETTGELPANLPLSAVRFAPPVNDRNTAPVGKVWPVPVDVQRQPESAAGRARTLTVEVSYDDGATWRNAPVVRSGQHGVVLLKHPASAGFVSLRAASTDTAGNTVRQTIIRAYEIG
jgi:subtilisin family serine protease